MLSRHASVAGPDSATEIPDGRHDSGLETPVFLFVPRLYSNYGCSLNQLNFRASEGS